MIRQPKRAKETRKYFRHPPKCSTHQPKNRQIDPSPQKARTKSQPTQKIIGVKKETIRDPRGSKNCLDRQWNRQLLFLSMHFAPKTSSSDRKKQQLGNLGVPFVLFPDLNCLCWCSGRTKRKQQQGDQQRTGRQEAPPPGSCACSAAPSPRAPPAQSSAWPRRGPPTSPAPAERSGAEPTAPPRQKTEPPPRSGGG